MKLFTSTLFALCSLFFVFCFSGCTEKNEPEKDPDNPEADLSKQASIFAVTSTTATKGQIQDYIAIAGGIIAGTTVDTYAETAGKVAAVYITIGQWVNKGQNIAAVDPSRPGMDYQWSYVIAPISGTIVTQPVRIGTTISPAVPLVRIAGGEALEIQLYVAERFISKMAMNLPCEITLDAWPGDVFLGSISEISPTIDPASRTMEIRVNVRNSDSKLKAGMFAKVKIITERKNNIVKIPVSAMISRFGEQYVYVIENDIVIKRPIVPGISIDGVLEIQEGLLPDEEVVLRGQTLLSDGARVNVVERVPGLRE